MADMTAKELLALLQEYDDCWKKYQERMNINALHGSGIWTVDPKRDALSEKMSQMKGQIEALGFGTFRDEVDVLCLYLAGQRPAFTHRPIDSHPWDDAGTDF